MAKGETGKTQMFHIPSRPVDKGRAAHGKKRPVSADVPDNAFERCASGIDLALPDPT